jgi:tetratricopeptide (TPR) repeat protein
MTRTVRSCLAPALLLALAPLHAQAPPESDRPTPHVPVRAVTRAELDRREALKLYGLAALHEHNSRLVEAVRTLEAALRLDPEAPAIHKALIPLYLGLDRTDDALASCRRALDLDPDDFETGYLYARQLRALDRPTEALAVLRKTAATPGLKERPDLRAQVCFDLGVLHEAGRNWDEAERSFRTVADILEHPEALLEQGPNSRDEINTQAADTYERLGRICLKAGHPDRAVKAFRQGQEKDPTRAARLAYNLAEVYARQGQLREALASVEQYLGTQPQGTEAYELKITLQRKLGRSDDVVPDLEAAAGRDRNNATLQLLLAREYRRAGRPDRALGVYGMLIAKSPSAEAYRRLFDLYQQDERTGADRILERLDEAVGKAAGKDKAPGDESAAAHARAMLLVLREDAGLVRRVLEASCRRLRDADPGRPLADQGLHYRTRVVLAALASRTRQLKEAEKLYRSCVYEAGGPRGVEQEAYAGLLRVLAWGRKYDAVIAVCERGLEQAQATNRVLFHLELAVAHLALGHPRQALAAADAACREAGKDERLDCQRVRVEVLSGAGRHQEAIAACRDLLKEYNQAKELRDIRLALSGAYLAAGDHARSEEQLRRILEADPNDATAGNNLGYQWADRNQNLDEAERLIRKALDLDRRQRATGTAAGVDSDRDNAGYLDSLGWVLFRRGRLAEACRELEKAAALPDGADDPVVWDHLGDVYFRLGQRDQAGAKWRQALGQYEAGARRRDERYQEIKDKLDKLRLLKP